MICPACGAIASMEAWANEPAWRQFAEVLTKIPKGVEERVLPYLGLFRKGERAMTPARALRLIADLHALVDPGTVKWESGELRPAPPSLWAQALDAVIARRPKALSNHNYLRHTAWEMAAALAAQAEQQVEAGRRMTKSVEEDAPGDGPASAEERAAVKDMLREFTERLGK